MTITPPMVLSLLSDGEAGIAETLALMSACVKQFKKFPPIRTLAARIAGQYRNKDWFGQIGGVFDFIQQNIAYVQDVTDIETLQTPVYSLQIGAGDCDDMVTALAAMLEAIGFHTRFVAIGFKPGDFNHVFLQVMLPDQSKWISLDPTEPNGVGWQPSGFINIKTKDN